MPVKKKPSPAQLAARAKFIKMVRAKAAAKKKAAPKKAAKKVAGLDKVTRKGKKTTVHYSRVSGIEKTISGLQKKYLAIFETPTKIISYEIFNATSLQDAIKYAKFHKMLTPEIYKNKNVKIKVKIYQ